MKPSDNTASLLKRQVIPIQALDHEPKHADRPHDRDAEEGGGYEHADQNVRQAISTLESRHVSSKADQEENDSKDRKQQRAAPEQVRPTQFV